MQYDDARRRSICERMRQRCREKGWFGPECDESRHDLVGGYSETPLTADDVAYFRPRGCPYEVYYDADFRRFGIVIDRTRDPLRHRFEYPPATGEQLRATEEALGHALPPMLRLLYSEIANGGFGPSYGITGVKGGWVLHDDGHHETIDQDTLWHSPDDTRPAVALETMDVDLEHPFVTTLPASVRPDHFVSICYDGCGNDYCIDLATGRVYYAGCGGGEGDGLGHWPLFVRREALSVEQWLEDWLNEKEPE